MKLRLFGQGGRTWWYYMYLKSLVLTYLNSATLL